MARPKKYDAEIIAAELQAYIDSVDDPHIGGYCSLPGKPSRETVYELSLNCKALSDILKRSLAKQESNMIDKAMNGKCNPIFAIFRLKQPAFGWTDKIQQEVDTKMTVEIQLPDNVKQLSK